MSAPLRRDDTSIDRLQTRGEPSGCARIQREIASAAWPQLNDDSWVFIRQLHTRASAQAIVPELLAKTQRILTSGGTSADVMRFANFNVLLAHLLTDLAQGQASRRWYWQRWRSVFNQSPSSALRSILSEHLRQLPAITSQLHHQHQLGTVWLRLTESDAAQLLEHFIWQCGCAGTWFDASASQDLPVSLPHQPLISRSLQQRWATVIAPLDESDSRRQLALAIMGQECSPLALQHAPRALLQQLGRQLEQQLGFVRVAAVSIKQKQEISAPKTAQRDAARASQNSASQVPSTTTQFDGRHLTPENSKASTPAATTAGVTPLMTTPAAEMNRRSNTQAAPPSTLHVESDLGKSPTPAPSPADIGQSSAMTTRAPTETSATNTSPLWQETARTLDSDHFHTRQAGLFYLLNFLNRAEPQRVMAANWASLPNGWCWVFWLGLELDLDLNDPLASFLAQQIGVDDVAGLLRLPPLPAKQTLLDWTERWYRRAELWQPSLLQLDADVCFSPSHCDVYAPMASVRLPIRLAGLDINPGWLPWLGRVVTFHYQ